MSSQFLESGSDQTCVVCQGSETDRGDTLMVFHRPDRPWCGYWIHQFCRRPDAPGCPCGEGPADDGVEDAGYFAQPTQNDGGHQRGESEETDDTDGSEDLESLRSRVLDELSAEPSVAAAYLAHMRGRRSEDEPATVGAPGRADGADGCEQPGPGWDHAGHYDVLEDYPGAAVYRDGDLAATSYLEPDLSELLESDGSDSGTTDEESSDTEQTDEETDEETEDSEDSEESEDDGGAFIASGWSSEEY